MGKAINKAKKKAVKKDPPLKLDMTFEEAVKLSIKTQIHKKPKKSN